MTESLYLERTLAIDDKHYSEQQILSSFKYIVVLAEPGAGKTELLKSFARKLGQKEIPANVFSYQHTEQTQLPVVIDAFDELAKIDSAGIQRLLAKIASTSSSQVIISSRSSEWSHSSTLMFESFVGQKPVTVRLCEFIRTEQEQIFSSYVGNENFDTFYSQVAKFSLESLLPNPQFLKLFADAYIESDRQFSSKQEIFKQAVERLAKEANQLVVPDLMVHSSQKIELASEVFAKLLLSGAEGIGISEASEERMYPSLTLMTKKTGIGASRILSTRLFKPGEYADQHKPVHKIVSEYCAANYLCSRLQDPLKPLPFEQCLSIIAPNSVVRDELRGLIGWMAALGDKLIEEALIELDPYAVLANGDPSLLSPSSKCLLLKKLKDLESEDPHFRRSDIWRRFSVAGFFTSDVVGELKELLLMTDDGQYRSLILELLVGSPVNELLIEELRHVLTDENENKYFRFFAVDCLLGVPSYNCESDVKLLSSRGSNESLEVAAHAILLGGADKYDNNFWKRFFAVCSELYSNDDYSTDRVIGERYFIRRLIDELNEGQLELLLDHFTKELYCVCGKADYECDCRTGISKIVGLLLDKYFGYSNVRYVAERIWRWLKPLCFRGSASSKDSKSVEVLYSNTKLREEILEHVFGSLNDAEQVLQLKNEKFAPYSHSHSALQLTGEDWRFLVTLAFESDNTTLWSCFMARHQRYRKKEELGVDSLRHLMRQHANQKYAFMREWARTNLKERAFFLRTKQDRRYRKSRRRSTRFERKRSEARSSNQKYIHENRILIEKGKHWGALNQFAILVISKPDKISLEVGDEELVRASLRNCLDFIEPDVPDLKKLSELQCESTTLNVERILFASCLEVFRSEGCLSGVKPELLLSLRTNLNGGVRAEEKEERAAFKVEVDRILFSDSGAAENFLREYVEPQLKDAKCPYPEVGLLRDDKIFQNVGRSLSIEWLERFEDLNISTLETLFEIAALSSFRERLVVLIRNRCERLMAESAQEAFSNQCKFWFTRAFYFLGFNEVQPYWSWLTKDSNSIFLFDEHSRQRNRSDNPAWPTLTAEKIECILDRFIQTWPKVYLPSSWGSDSPVGETAYRFLKDIIWSIGYDTSGTAIEVLTRLLTDERFSSLFKELKSIYAEQLRKSAFVNFEPPSPEKVSKFLDSQEVITVEILRKLVLNELSYYQSDIIGGEFNAVDRFYVPNTDGGYVRRDEVKSVELIAERLSLRLQTQNIIVTSEHQTKNQNRIDITVAKMFNGKRKLLVVEAKGQWHSDLYSAANAQLYERYSIHPDAAQQGIYLVLWFGKKEKVAGRKLHGISSAQELKLAIEEQLTDKLKGVIDVFVLDVSRG
ncbi:hypothetical protein [Vibrio cyclitrophicus]|uniref:hypothetical protein n=1 Tax=Vibrio cyclitrophicus TaxID=47951 RepID=UPI0035A72F8E